MSLLRFSAKPKEAPKAEQQRRPLGLESLSLHAFRNYRELKLKLDARPVVLTGHNGAGKTNILEAVSLLTPGRGLRRATIAEMNNHQHMGTPWAIVAKAQGIAGEVKIATGRAPETLDKRVVKIDEKLSRSQAELSRHMAILWLTPQMEQLFYEGASASRKFLDRLVFGFDPEHASRVNEYEFAMRERNRLLTSPESTDGNWLDALEQTMAETSSAIAAARLQTVGNINHAILSSPLSFPKAHITVLGMAEKMLADGQSAVAVEEAMKEYWRHVRREDALSGRTQSGAHRAEMLVMHTGKNMPADACSTGEQKALLLSIILAQARATALWRGVVPILLLDEVVSHLDAAKRLELFEEISDLGAQTWMTGTDADLFATLKGKSLHFQVADGNLLV